MTEVRYDLGDKILIEVSGHCEDSVICSCISTLAAALEGWLANNEVGYDYRVDDGYCCFDIMEGGRVCAEMFLIGVMRLEKMFPDMVKTTDMKR